jgi:Rrf2 family cysteine metabolism transcriptional repressor
MDISVKGEYALRAVFELCSRGGGDPIKIADIAAKQGIPQKFLELILSQLKQGGFLNSRRGASGGYSLAKTPESITVGDIIRHIEGPIGVARRGDDNPRPADSPFEDLWHEVDTTLSSIIDRTTFADLLARWKEKRTRQAVSWQI